MTDAGKLARGITRAASLQTFYTISRFVDRGRQEDAFRAYAYFRWLDDRLDTEACDQAERQALVARQNALIDRCYRGDQPAGLDGPEAILVGLIENNPDPSGPLAVYVRNLMTVMSFDAERRGRLITQVELNAYQHSLAVAVTEAMHFFIGGHRPAPQTAGRYLAVTAAHITHMLRDTREDLQAGYFNIPSEYLRAHGISPLDVDTPPYREWVRLRVEQARASFQAGRHYLQNVESLRCRLAAHAYSARFEVVLDLIQRDGFVLRADYGASKTLGAGLRMAGSILASSLGLSARVRAYGASAPDGFDGGS